MMARVATRSLATQTHGRYVVAAPDRPGPHALLVGFHGYGQSAEQHLAYLRRRPGTDGFVVVAVQALHLFYTRGGPATSRLVPHRKVAAHPRRAPIPRPTPRNRPCLERAPGVGALS